MNDHLQIELDALRALSGADEVRKKLLAGVSMGDPSIESLAYLIKCRVKAHDRLVEKILDRRAKGKPDYSASDVTDIVGLRVLTLYRAELPVLVKHFLEFVTRAQGNPMHLFAGSDLRDTLNEIIVYRASGDGDITDDLVVKEFERFNLLCKLVPPGAAPDSISADVRIVRKQTEYSSIHIVLSCVGVSKDSRFGIPLEVQLRTALEDVWGEIDHSLNYKFKQGKTAADTDRLHYENAVGHLRQLKRQLDNCTLSADLIHQQIKNIFAASSYSVKPNVGARSVDTERLLNLDLSASIKKDIKECVSKIRSLFDKMYGEAWPTKPKDIVDAISEFTVVAKTLDDCWRRYSKNPSKNSAIDQDVTYYLRMERSLCLYWVGYLKLRESPDLKGEKAKELELALKEYFLLEKDSRFANDPILAFRVANALKLRGDHELALDKLEESVDKLRDSTMDPKHAMRVRIPRQLSIMYWETAERIKRKAAQLNNPDLLLKPRQTYYLKALDLNRSLYGHQISSDATGHSVREDKAEARITVNNILDYTLCYLNSKGSWGELENRDLSKEKIGVLLRELTDPGMEVIDRATIADTIREVASYIGDKSLANDAARRVLALIDKPDFAFNLPEEAIEEMRSDAQAQLASESGSPSKGMS